MEIIELKTKDAMVEQLDILNEAYPNLTRQEFLEELDIMLPHNYGMIGVFENDKCLGISGYWLGSKLWCGKYLELDNVVVKEEHRNKGVGKLLFGYLKEKAETENCSMLALDAYTDNFPAHKFYYREGYIPRGFHFINIIDSKGIRDTKLGT